MNFNVNPSRPLWGLRVRFHDDRWSMASPAIGEHPLDELASLNEPFLTKFGFSLADLILQAFQVGEADRCQERSGLIPTTRLLDVVALSLNSSTMIHS